MPWHVKVAGEGMERIGQTAVLGELLAGVLIGPAVFGLVRESEVLHAAFVSALRASEDGSAAEPFHGPRSEEGKSQQAGPVDR
jgi:hypothetical protein